VQRLRVEAAGGVSRRARRKRLFLMRGCYFATAIAPTRRKVRASSFFRRSVGLGGSCQGTFVTDRAHRPDAVTYSVFRSAGQLSDPQVALIVRGMVTWTGSWQAVSTACAR
jgi:hypothetical protein